MEYISAKTIISSYAENNNWFGNNYNMNIYKGCCHGCIYCDSRSECYRVEDFDTVRLKENALNLIEKELKSKRKTGVIGTGAMSDPYNPFEKGLCLTRRALELIDKYGFGVSIATKSNLIIRDIDILQRIRKHSPVLCKITITTSDDEISRKIEPNVAVSSERFLAIKRLTDAGIFAGVLLMPVLPFIADNEENVLQLVKLAGESGARFIYPAFGVTLRANQRDYFYKKLDELFPSMKERYVGQYGNSYECHSPNARRLYKLLSEECRKYGILYRMNDIIAGYKSAYESKQMTFF
ncbi:MAG: radical SAM protein [Clostridiales bacterium]|jgi:DNA repair photolyase|nr:radical SAM protein [Clostridiales bacterium]